MDATIHQTTTTLPEVTKIVQIKYRPSARRINRRRQRKSRAISALRDTQYKAIKSPRNKTFLNGKNKLYAEKPLGDPEKERARLNALNAKRNRDLKKKEAESMSNELYLLKKA